MYFQNDGGHERMFWDLFRDKEDLTGVTWERKEDIPHETVILEEGTQEYSFRTKQYPEYWLQENYEIYNKRFRKSNCDSGVCQI